MECPHCHKKIQDTAIRCKFCRKVVKKKPRSLKRLLNKLFFDEKDASSCKWSFLDIAAIALLVAFFVFYDPFGLGRRLSNLLRLHFFIFTKEPKIFYYLTIYANTIILNFFCFVFIVILVKLRRLSFWNSVIFSGSFPRSLKWVYPYIGICLLFRFINQANPLAPNIPLNSVFIEARIIGNAVIIFLVLFVAPLVEEALFRGFLYPAFNKYMGIYPAIFFTSALSTLAHYPQIKEEFLFMAVIFALSVIITYARAKTGSTWVAILMHFIYNLVYVVIGFISYAIVKY